MLCICKTINCIYYNSYNNTAIAEAHKNTPIRLNGAFYNGYLN